MGRGFIDQMDIMKILEATKIYKYFGELAAVNDVSFHVDQGEVFGIAGPNGAGKTTLFNTIAGKLHGTGKIIFDGLEINGLRPHQICHNGIARTFQIPILFSTLTVYENVRVAAHFGSKEGKGDSKNIVDALNFVGLEGKENVKLGALTLFYKKLTMLAATLATHPKLLLLDEPLGGLNIPEVRKSVSLIQKIRSELGVTIIIIEHLMKVLVEVSDRLMILHSGKNICIGIPEDVARDKRVIEVYLGERYA
jgi:branched-chain amino acid transport system ATP-binding protein